MSIVLALLAATTTPGADSASTMVAGRYAMAVECAATHAELAAILIRGQATSSDRADAARFAGVANGWLERALAARPDAAGETRSAVDAAKRELDHRIGDSAGPADVEALLDARLARCPAQAGEATRRADADGSQADPVLTS